jgi:hypothetical protein
MDPRHKSVTEPEPKSSQPLEQDQSADEALPASPTFDVEAIPSDPSEEPVSTHNFCTTCSTN